MPSLLPSYSSVYVRLGSQAAKARRKVVRHAGATLVSMALSLRMPCSSVHGEPGSTEPHTLTVRVMGVHRKASSVPHALSEAIAV